ncbi:probable glutathione S-transferase GSTU1 [Triticum urartu]|uniref:probable glutathione S-transferase GSTU1 n=1 Tax=Triticum urartu TaxID=4572 RepID=UPI002043D075|nr:probable glutathione S-transferase GSTU1 [Triticum urartu]
MAGEKTTGLVLLDFWVSPFAQRCRIALAEKGLACESLEQELLGAKSDLLLGSNPVHKKVPVLLHDGRAVCESLVILEYIEDAFAAAAPRLLPADPHARAQARFWADYVDKRVYSCGTRLWKLKGEGRAAARVEMLETLRTLDAELGGRAFFGGEALGFVDVALIPLTSWFYSYEKHGGFSVEEECPGLAEWARRCGERESVAKVLTPPEEVHDFICLLKKHYGVE